MNKPKISVIMSVYDEKAKEINKSINSILNQTFHNFEYIIVLDNPNNIEIKKLLIKVKEKDRRVKLIYNNKNIGLTKSLNKGLKIAKGIYIARMDADDISSQNRFQEQYNFLEKRKDIFLIGSEAIKIDENNNLKQKISCENNWKKIKKKLPNKNLFVHPSIMFRNENELYREKFIYAQDYDFYLNLLSKNKKMSNIKKTLLKYRVREKSISMSKKLLQEKYASQAKKQYKERKRFKQDSYKEMHKEIKISNQLQEINLIENKTKNYFKNLEYKKGTIELKKFLKKNKTLKEKIILIIKCIIYLSLYKYYKSKLKKSKEKTLGLLFTRGISLDIWNKSGILKKELENYDKLLNDKIFDKIILFTYGKNDKKYKKEIKKEYTIIQKPKWLNFPLSNYIYPMILFILKKNQIKKCHILKSNQLYGTFSYAITKFIHGKKLIIRSGYTPAINFKEKKDYLRHYIYKLFDKIIYNLADLAIVTTKSQKKYVQKQNNKLNIKVIPNSIDIKKFKPIKIKKKNKFVFVGRLSKEKNIFEMINAIEHSKASIDIYGEGPLKKEIEDYIKLKNVSLKGKISNDKLPNQLNKYMAYIQCSFYEGMPKTILEAMACGLPIVATDVKGINEVVINNETGLLSKTDFKSISKSINSIINNKKLRIKLSNNARREVVQNYSKNTVIKEEEKIYKRILNQ